MQWKSILSMVSGSIAGGLGIFGLSICCLPVAAGFAGLLGVIAVFFYHYATWLLIVGALSLMLSIFLLWKRRFRAVLSSLLTCPECGFQKKEDMPQDSCTYFYECTKCHVQLKPKSGDCCVFCSYGDVPCPPKQKECGCSAISRTT